MILGAPGITSALDNEAAEVVREVLNDAGARATTLRGIAASFDYVMDDSNAAALRDTARHVVTDEEVSTQSNLLRLPAGLPQHMDCWTPCRMRRPQRPTPRSSNWCSLLTLSLDRLRSGDVNRFVDRDVASTCRTAWS